MKERKRYKRSNFRGWLDLDEKRTATLRQARHQECCSLGLDLDEKRTATIASQLEHASSALLDLDEKRTATKLCSALQSPALFFRCKWDLDEKRTATIASQLEHASSALLDLDEKRTAT